MGKNVARGRDIEALGLLMNNYIISYFSVLHMFFSAWNVAPLSCAWQESPPSLGLSPEKTLIKTVPYPLGNIAGNWLPKTSNRFLWQDAMDV